MLVTIFVLLILLVGAIFVIVGLMDKSAYQQQHIRQLEYAVGVEKSKDIRANVDEFGYNYWRLLDD